MMLRLSLAAIAVAVTGCATPTFSYIDGNRYHRAELNTYSVIVLDIDGKSYLQRPVMVEPGVRVIRVQAPPGTRFGRGDDRTMTVDVKPCTRYFLKAVKQNSLDDDFVPMVDHEEPISGCRPASS